MTTIKVAFYKYPKTKPWYATFFNRLTCWWTRGEYSHVEIVLSEQDGVYECGSSSARDHGVRVKSMPLPPAKWDIVEVEGDPERVRAWFARESGKKYDYLAWLGFLFRREHGSDSKWFCSEAIADCLGYRDAWRFDPNTLFVVLRRANDFNNKKVGE